MGVSYGMRKGRNGSRVVCALVSAPPLYAIQFPGAALGAILAATRPLSPNIRRRPAAIAADAEGQFRHGLLRRPLLHDGYAPGTHLPRGTMGEKELIRSPNNRQ
jgi:hypothetical protein